MLINGHKLYLADVKEPPTLSSWIHYQQSLTDKLQQATGSANIVLLSQQWVKPSWWDKYLLMIDDPVIFQREITMQSQDVAYWYAKTLIPQQCYDLNPDFFNRLQQESVRNLVFDCEQVKRVQMLSYPVDINCIEYSWAKKYLPKLETELWVRYSEYSFLDQESFYLLEILLPELAQV